MAAKRNITPLTKQTAIEQAEVQALVQTARDDVAKRVRALAEKAKIASGAERQKLYDQIAKINDALGDDLDAWARQMTGRVGMTFHQLTLADLKAAGKKLGKDVVTFDRSRVETYLRLIHPDNAQSIAAVFTKKMTPIQVGQLRQATVEVFRQSAVSNMTAVEINKALQQRWNEAAGSIEFDRFTDRGGRKWTNAEYLSMLVRTTTARVARESSIDTQVNAGFDLARVRNVGDTCPICNAWDGVIISLSGKDKRFPSYQQSMNAGLWHPNCDCLHEYVDETTDKADVEKQGAVPNPDFKSIDGAPVAEKAKAIENYKAEFGGAVFDAERARIRAEGQMVAFSHAGKAAAEAAEQAAADEAFRAKQDAIRAEAEKAAFASAAKAAERAYEAAKVADAAAAAKRVALADNGILGAKEFGATLKRAQDKVGGSTGAFVTADPDGQKWIVKHYAGNAAQVQNEFVANRMYAAAGVRVPDMRLVEFDGKLGVASKVIDQAKPIGPGGVAAAAKSAAIKSGFAADAWLANWDVAGADHDNVLQVGSSKDLIRVDQGGALLFRAQGKPKGTAFGAAVNELTSLRDAAINPKSASLFAGVTDDDVAKQIRALKRSVKMATVDEVIAKAGMTGPDAKVLRQTLNARLTWLKQWERDYTAAQKAAAAPKVAGIPPGVERVAKQAELDTATTRAWAKMTAAEREAVKRYTGAAYATMNRAAVKGAPATALDQALNKLPRYEGFVGRGHGDLSVHAQDWEKWKSGEYAYWANKGYSSTAVIPEKVWSKPFKIIIKQKGLQPGGYVAPVSTHMSEKEYLLGRGNKYRVAGWGENAKGTSRFLLVEEADDPTQVPDRQAAPPRLDYDTVINEWRATIK